MSRISRLQSLFLGQWFSVRAAQRRRGAKTLSLGAVSQTASLETRRMLAGTTNVTFAAGTLTLTSIDDFTQAGVLAGKNNNVIVLTGGAAGVVNISGNAETFTGGIAFTGVTKITVNGKDGNDNVTFTNVSITGLATVLGGDGENTVTGAGGSLGSLTITNGDGFDNATYSTATVVGAVTITNGEGGSRADFTTVTLGSLKITNVDGADNVSFNAVNTVSGTTQIDNGSGDSDIRFNSSTTTLNGALTIKTGDGNVHGAGLLFASAKAITITNGNGNTNSSLNGTVVGAVSITNGEGDDIVQLISSVNITGNVAINHKGGGSSSSLRGTVTGNLTVTALAGDDFVIPGAFQAAADTNLNVTGTTTLNLGSGDNVANFQSTGALVFGGALSITAADGDDLFLSSSTASFKAVTMNWGNGDSRTDLRGTITGNLSITSLAGNDQVNAPVSLTVTGTTTLNSGNGESKVNFQSTGTLNFGGALSVTSGDGDDEFKIKSPNTYTMKAVTINWGLGDSETVIDGTIINMDALSIIGNFGDHQVTFKGLLLNTKNVTLNFKGRRSGMIVDGAAALMTINGNLSITGADGESFIDFDHPLNVTGTTTFTGGTGNDTVQFRGGGTMTGAVTVTGNAGFETFVLERMTLAGNLTANLGTNDDRVDIDNSVLKGTVVLTLGAGTDFVNIEQLDLGTKSTFEKAVTINADAGVDLINIGRAADNNDFAQFLAAFTVNGGLGIDQAFFKNAGQGGTRFNLFGILPVFNGIEVQL